MKKIGFRVMSIIIVLSLVLSTLCTFVLAEDKLQGDAVISDYNASSDYEYAVSYLQMLGILSDIDANAYITRGQAVSAIIRALGHEDVALLSGSMYTYDEKMALFAHGCGILAGNTPAEWILDNPATGAQLAKMLVVALGYGAVITSPDAFPNEYLAYASKLGLTKGTVSFGSETVTCGDFAIMLTNAMKAQILELVGVYSDDAMYEVVKGKTLESVYLKAKNLSIATGVVESDYYTSTISGAKCEYSQIRINGTTYVCESEKLKDFVGYDVEFAYYNSTRESDRKIVGIRLNADTKVYKFNCGNDVSYSNGALYYEGKNQKEEKLYISPDAVFVINNLPLSSYNAANIDYSQYSLKLIDNNDDKKCDFVFLTKSESMIVNYIKDDIIYFSYGTLNSKNVIDLSKRDETNDVLLVVDVKGAPLNISDIKPDSSISVIASDDFSYIEIILLPDIQSGKFEEYNSLDNTIVVDGKLYGLKKLNAEFTLGNTYMIRVNENNEIFYIENIVSGCSYIVDKTGTSQGLSNGIKIKIFDNENGLRVFDIADKLTVDGTSYSGDQNILDSITTGTLAYVALNGNGEVKKIEYLNKYGETAKRLYRHQASGFNDVKLNESIPFRFNEDTIFFYIPKSGNDADFGFSLPLKNKDEYTTAAYELNDETGFVKAIVIEVDNDMRTDNYITYSSDVGIITSVKQVVDDDGQGVYKIEGFHDGKEFAYTSGHYADVFSVCATLKSGDVVRYIANYNNEIVRIQKTVSLEDTTEFFHDGKDTTDERFFGQVVTLSKNVLTNYSEYLCHEMNVSTNLSYNNLAYMRFWADLVNPYDSQSQFSNYYAYNIRTKEVSVASIDDIITYEMAGDSASKVFVQRSKSDVQCIVIVKE